jgi:hypothetical protein
MSRYYRRRRRSYSSSYSSNSSYASSYGYRNSKAALKVRHFDSLVQFGQACRDAGIQSDYQNDWYGGDSIDDCIRRCEVGSTKLVAKAEALVDKFRDSVDISRLLPSWQLEISGARPNVAAFLAGHPQNMYRRVAEESDRAPLTIWACVTSSGGVEADQLLKRGTAITALYLALSATRAVSLRVFSGLGDYGNNDGILSVAFPQPIALSQAAFAFASQGFARGLTYKWLNNVFNTAGAWPSRVGQGSREQRIKDWIPLLGAQKGDIIFPHVFYNDEDVLHPISYVTKLIKQFTHED